MKQEKVIVGFIGSGGIARSHIFSLNSLRFFYDDAPEFELAAVCSARKDSRSAFAKYYGFSCQYDLEEFVSDKDINTVFILGPNHVHYKHLESVTGMNSIKRIYLEKPVCSSLEEEKAMEDLVKIHPEITIQVGFQFLFSSAIREMLKFWRSGKLGKPLHFDLKYWHGDYLRKDYRNSRSSRLGPAPGGGAMSDLGSHSLSLVIAMLGTGLKITSAIQGGGFDDVDEKSDLFSLISVLDIDSGAVGTISASRISSGSGDYFSVEMYAEEGAIRYSTLLPDSFEFFLELTGTWQRKNAGSNYLPYSSFPSCHVPPGWTRSMVHAHYVFLTDNINSEFVPDVYHGLAVQRLVNQTADHLKKFRGSANII